MTFSCLHLVPTHLFLLLMHARESFGNPVTMPTLTPGGADAARHDKTVELDFAECTVSFVFNWQVPTLIRLTAPSILCLHWSSEYGWKKTFKYCVDFLLSIHDCLVLSLTQQSYHIYLPCDDFRIFSDRPPPFSSLARDFASYATKNWYS